MVDPNLRWVYPYTQEPVGRAYPPGTEFILRPVIAVSVIGPKGEGADVRQAALVDSGSENCIAGPSIAMLAGVDPDPETQIRVGIGGKPRNLRFGTVTLRLWPPPGVTDQPIDIEMELGFVSDWDPPWPVVLGQRGFFDHFTVTVSRYAQAVAIESVGSFDERFGVQIREEEQRRSRFDI